MAYPTVFANLAGGTQPASLLDTMFNICGNQGNIGCTASGTNAITLTPITNEFLPAAYVNYQMASFTPAASSTGPVTLQIGSLGFLRVFTVVGTQAGVNDLEIGGTYTVVFNQGYDAGAGGWQIISAFGNIISAAQQSVPGGYLSMVTGTPVISADTTVSAPNPIFYTPVNSTNLPIFNGAEFLPFHFSELQLALDATMLANNIYDVFGFINAGAPTIGTGPSWSAGGGNITAGSCARGTGAGSTALTRLVASFGTGGILVNAVAITARNGATNFSVPINQATYLASIFMDSVNGQLTCHRSEGQSRKWGIWNYFNRMPLNLIISDPAANWATTSTFTTRPANNNTANSLTLFTGVAEEAAFIEQKQNVKIDSTAAAINSSLIIGCGINSTNSFNASIDATSYTLNFTAGAATSSFTAPTGGNGRIQPSSNFGINVLTATESVFAVAANNTVTFLGNGSGNKSMFVQASWRG